MKRKIRIIAPARAIDREIAEHTLSYFARSPHRADFDLEFDDQCFETSGHFAGSDAAGATALRAALADETVAIVWAARGGYGSARLLDRLDNFEATTAKIFAGYSDCGFLSACFLASRTVRAVHAPMPVDIVREHGESAIANALTGFRALVAGGAAGDGRGPPAFVVNLTVLTKLIGTKWEPDLAGCILIVEDVSEHLYAIDRMFFQLSSWRGAKAIAGIGLGQFTNIPENDVPFGETIVEMAERWFGPLGIRVIPGFQIGHFAGNRVFAQGGRDWESLIEPKPRRHRPFKSS